MDRDRLSPVQEEPSHFVVRIRATATADGGRRSPILSDYRPQLWLGQTMADGERIYWEVRLTDLDVEPLKPGSEGIARMRLLTFPALGIVKGERLEFFEGSRKVADGEVLAVQVVGHPQFEG